METLTSPKSEYLLEAGLDVLHFESREWLSDLKFQKSELDFFLKLLNSKVFKLDEEPQRQQRLDNKAAGECIKTEQCGQFVDNLARWP